MKLLVFLLLPCLSLSEVVEDFRECSQFFLEKKPPQFTLPAGVKVPVQYTTVKEICQCVYDDSNQKKYIYATLYNTAWRIPIYSAYVIKRKPKIVRRVGRCDAWYIEPQLGGETEPCMATQGYNRNIGYNQAVNCDYEGSGYDRGHLYPVHHTDTHLSMLATSTLTNAAPQDSQFNKNQWKYNEKTVIKDLASCESEAYVVTGVVPETNIKIPKRDANVNSKDKQKYERVNVSKYYWRAYCCLTKNSLNKLEYTGKGYFGPDNNKVLQTLSITALQTQLAADYGVSITIFPSLPIPPILPPNPGKRPSSDEDENQEEDDCI